MTNLILRTPLSRADENQDSRRHFHCRSHFLERVHHRAIQPDAHDRDQNGNQGYNNRIDSDGARDIRGYLLLQALSDFPEDGTADRRGNGKSFSAGTTLV